MNQSKLILLIVGAAAIVFVGIFLAYQPKNTGKDAGGSVSVKTQPESGAPAKSAQGNQAEDLQKTKAPPDQAQSFSGCPDGQNITQTDERGRFKPTLDISNKTAVLDTSMGKIAIQIYDKDAPKTAENFICLIKKGYYNGVSFHRVARNFVIQAGDPTGTGAGGKSVYGDTFEDELYPDAPSYQAGYKKGVVAMANRGKNTNSSQFFIMLADRELLKNYTIFGKVISGLDVVDKIGAVPINPGPLGPEDGAPKTKIIIKSATIK